MGSLRHDGNPKFYPCSIPLLHAGEQNLLSKLPTEDTTASSSRKRKKQKKAPQDDKLMMRILYCWDCQDAKQQIASHDPDN